MAEFLVEEKINILLCVGGDSTLRGAQDVAKEVQRRGLNLAVVGIPKTIDNVDPHGLLWSSVLATTGQPRQWIE